MFEFGNKARSSVQVIGKSNMGQGTSKGIHNNGVNTTASVDRYLPNNETLDSASLLDELIPQSEDGLLKIFRTIAKTDSVGGPVIDMISSFAWSDGSLSGISDPEIMSFYDEAFHMIDPQSFLPQATQSYLTDGKIVGSLIYDSDRGTFTDLISQDPLYLDFIPIPINGFDPKINYKGNANFKKFINSNDPRDELAKARIPKLLSDKLGMGGKVPLEPLNTLYVPRIVNPFDWLGTSLLWRILPFYALEKALWNASIASARRRARSITHIKCGIQDYWEPTQADLDNIVNYFMQSEEDPVGAYVITRDGVETNDVRQANDFWKISEEWDMLTSGKTRALGFSEALLSGDTAIGTSEQATALFIESVKILRNDITNRIFYRKMFANIARAHGFVRKKDTESTAHAINRMDATFNTLCKQIKVTGSVNGPGTYMVKSGLTVDQALDIAYKDLLIPQITWKKQLSPTKDDSYMQLLQTLEEKGVPISKKQWASAGGLDITKQIEDMDEDLLMQEMIQKKLAKKPKGEESEEDEDTGKDEEDEDGWAGASTTKISGIANIFDNVVRPNKSTFFGVGPKRLRKAVRTLFKSDLGILNSSKEVKRVLSQYYEGSNNKVEAACYLLNRSLLTDVLISPSFLTKVATRIDDRLKITKESKKIKGLMKEQTFLYSQMAKHNKKKKVINIPNAGPDKITGSRIYAGLSRN